MSYDPQQIPPTRSYGQPQPFPLQPGQWTPMPAPRKTQHGAGFWIYITLAAVVTLFLFSGAVLNFAGDGSHPGNTLAAGTATDSVTTADHGAPKPANFTLTPKITQRRCTDTFGCLISLTVDVDYHGRALSDDDTWTITYELTGAEGGPVIDQVQVTGSQYSTSTQFISTVSTSTRITIEATRVEKI